MADAEKENWANRCLGALEMPGPSLERARALYRVAILIAKQAYDECKKVGVDPEVEYHAAVDEAKAYNRVPVEDHI